MVKNAQQLLKQGWVDTAKNIICNLHKSLTVLVHRSLMASGILMFTPNLLQYQRNLKLIKLILELTTNKPNNFF
jgi:hypothetical protein